MSGAILILSAVNEHLRALTRRVPRRPSTRFVVALLAAAIFATAFVWTRGHASSSSFPWTLGFVSVSKADPLANTISGTLNAGASTNKKITLLINGGSPTSVQTDLSGVFTFSTVTYASGDVLTVYVDDETQKGATVTRGDTGDITNLNIEENALTVRHEDSGPITNANLATGNGGDSDLNAIYTVAGGTLNVAAGKELRIFFSKTFAPGGDVNVGGNWTNNGAFTAGSNTVTFNGTANQTIGGLSSTTFSTLTINPSPATVVVSLANSSTTVSTALNVTTGVFSQGETGTDDFSLTTNTVTVAAGATWRNVGKGDLTLSGDVSNLGTINFNANGLSCGQADDIVIASSAAPTQRTWSGTGTFSMTDVAVSYQKVPGGIALPLEIIVNSGTDGGNNNGWTFTNTCSGPYTWVGGVSQDWTTPTNWSPVRPTAAAPTTSDDLIFDGSMTSGPTVINVPSQQILTLKLINGVNGVMLNAAATPAGTKTLTIAGVSGSDLSIPAGTLLTLEGAVPLELSLTAGSKSSIGGEVLFQDAPHRLWGADGSPNPPAIKFTSGSFFTTTTAGFSGDPFGTGSGGNGAPGSVEFQSGSQAFFGGNCGDPFGTSVPPVTTFDSGSTQKLLTSTALSYSGRSYGNLILDGSQTYDAGASSDKLTVQNSFEIESGSTFKLSSVAGGDLNLLGNFDDQNTGAALDPNNRTVKFQGGNTTQTIFKASGAESFFDLFVSLSAGGEVKMLSPVTITGQLDLNTANSVLELNSKTLTLNGTVAGSGALKGDLTGSTLIVGGTGALGPLNFVSGARTLSSMTVSRSSGIVTLGNDLTVGSSLDLTDGRVDMGSNMLVLAAAASASHSNGYVIGNLQKNFGATGGFTFHVGTLNAYSPVDANVTINSSGALTVKAVEGKQPNIPGTNALQRYWTLAGSGLTTDLTFHYRGGPPASGDVVGDEARYKVFKYAAGLTQPPNQSVDTNAHTATVTGVASFSDWTLADPRAVYADLNLTKTDSPDPVTEGNNLTYLITVTNNGLDATGVTVNDPLPANVTFVSATSSQGSCTGTGTVNCTLGAINSGGNATVRIVVAPTHAAVNTSLSNTATVSENETDANNADNSANATTQVNPAVCTPPPSGMVAWWPGDGNADDVVGGHNGVLQGGATFAPAKVDQGFSLDGTNGHVEISHSAAVNPTTAISIDAWIKPDDVSSGRVILSKYDSAGGGQRSYGLWIKPGGSLNFFVQNGANFRAVTAPNPIPVGVFTHVAGTFDAANSEEIKLYVDGVDTLAPLDVGSTTIGTIGVSPNTPVEIGWFFNDPGTYFQGTIDEVELFNTALAASDIANIYNASFAGKCRTCTPAPGGMISWWDGSGIAPTANDIQGTNSGTLQGSTTFAPGKVGPALSFDGNAGSVSVSDSLSLHLTSQLTLDAWVNPVSLASTPIILSKFDGSSNSYELHLQPDGSVRANVSGDGTTYDSLISGVGVVYTGAWFHVATTFNAGDWKIYVNGIQVAYKTSTVSSIFPGTATLFIGRDTGTTHYFNGLIDEVEIFNTALSQPDLAAITDAGNAGKCHTSTIQFSSASYNVTEGNTSKTITVTRTGAHDTPASFHYATSAGTATAGVDYDDVSGDLTFDPGQVTKTFDVPIHDDSIYEGDETVSLQLSTITGTGVTPGAPLTATLTINDDESPPNITINDVQQAEGSPSGTTDFVFTVNLSTPTQSGVTVNYSTADGTTNPATAGSDYVAASGSVLIPPNSTTGQITILVNKDTIVEADETFFVNLTGTTVGTITGSQGTGTIINDDTDVSIAVSPSSVLEDSGNPLVYTFTRNGVTNTPLTVSFSVGGTAKFGTNSGDDYTQTGAASFSSSNGTVTFGAGNTTTSVNINPTADSTYEADETVILTLTSGSDYNVINPSSATGTIRNDDNPPTILVVNSTADTDDGFCLQAPDGNCTLREAINAANTNSDTNTISFNIDAATDSGCVFATGVCTIKPTTALPVIVNPVTIDGYTQKPCGPNSPPCSHPNTLANGEDAVLLIELSGASAPPNTDGLVVTAGATGNTVDGSTISGLVINRFGGSGVKVTTAGGNFTPLNQVVGNFIGTDVTGLLASDTNGVFGNKVGVLVDNTSPSMIGCTTPDERNIISANTSDGVQINGAGAIANLVQGNFIGTDRNRAALGNGGAGISISEAFQSIIGFDTSGIGNGNLIAYNTGNGVEVKTAVPGNGTGNVIRGNSIHDNGGLGIDLGGDGVTANDPGDGDPAAGVPGANNLQNFPVIKSVVVDTPSTISGTLSSSPNQTFTIDFYSNPAGSCDPSGNGEGRTYLGSKNTTTDGSGLGGFRFNLDPGALNVGEIVTATATDSAGNTSEFSVCSAAARPIAFGQFSFAQANTDFPEGNSGTATANVVVKRTGGADRAVTVDFQITDGTATTGDNDYSATNGTLTWANGDASDKNIPITVNGDTKFEPDETVNIKLVNATGGATIAPADTATLTIKNDDSRPTISIGDPPPQNEGSSGQANLVFNAILTNPSSETITVHYSTANGSATGGGACGGSVDYVTSSGTVTFNPADTSMPINVPVCGDTVVEPNETFTVTLDTPTNASIGTGTATGTIVNDDADVSLSVSPSSVAEDSGTGIVYTFTRVGATGGALTVNFTVGGTTDPSNDYTQTGASSFTPPNGTVTIGAGNSTATVTIHPTADTTVEPDETVILTLASGTGYNVVTPGPFSATIANDDTDVTVAVSPSSVLEDGAANLVYTFTRTGVTSGAITANFSVSGTASFPSDYAQSGAASFGASSGTVTFGDGVTSATVTIDPTVDTTYESNETVILTVTPGTGYNPGVPGAATGTITNDDPAPTLRINNVTKNEGNSGITNFVFTVTKVGTTQVTATVHFDTADGTTNPATGGGACGAGVDYVSQSGNLSFASNETSKTITIAVCGDTVVEANETFFVELSAATDATISDPEGRGTIQNDDAPPPLVPVNTTDDMNFGSCSVSHCSLREAINTANLSTGAVSINFAIPANDPRHFYYKDDGAGSSNGHVTLANVAVTTASSDASISDIDPDWPHSWWSILPTSALPAITQTVTIDGYSQTGAVANTNTLAPADSAVLTIELNGASAGAGVTGLTLSGSTSNLRGLVINRFTGDGLNLAGGNSSAAGTFIGTDVSGTLDLGNAGSGISSAGFSESIGGSTPADVNLISGNDGGISFTNSNSDLILGNLIGTKADGSSRLGNTGNGISFSGAGSVFNTIGGTLPGEGNTIGYNDGDGVQLATAGVGNSIRGNAIFGNISTPSHLGIDLGPDGVTPNDPKDPDTGPNNLQNFPVITLALVTGSTKTINGTLNSTVGDTFDIDFYADDGCDDNGNVKAQTYLGSVTTDATDANGDVSFAFHPDASHAAAMTADKVITATATRSFTPSDTSEFSACFPVSDGSPGAGDIQFTSATYTVGEGGGSAAITVTRVGGSNGSITANFSTSDGTAQAPGDYTAVNSFPITYVEGETGTKTVNVTINDDSIYEGNETINLSLGSSQINAARKDDSAAQLQPQTDPHAAVLTIIDNDTAPTFAIDDVTHNEGNSGTTAYTFTVTKGGNSTELNATVDYATVNGTATAPSDFTAIPTTTLTFLPEDTTMQFTVLVNGDTVVEPTEAFTVHLSNAVNATISRADGTGTITNDDTDVSVAVSPAAVTEDGATNLVYTFTRNGVTSSAMTVNFTVGGTATFGTDYTQSGAATFGAASGTVTFGAGNSTATVTVDPTADSTVEPDETVILTVTSGAGYNVASPNSATGTILNDDTDVTVAVSPAAVLEDGPTNLVYTFTRNGVTSGALTVNFSVGGTATFGTDYTQSGAATFGPASGTVTFGAGNTTATVTVDPTADTIVEPDETVILTVTSGTGYNVASPSAATGTIINDDTDVSVAVSPASVPEDGPTNLVYTFTRNGVTSGALTVNFSVGGTATFGTDYTQSGAATFGAASGTVTFGAGNSTAAVTVHPTADTIVEPDETVILAVTSGTSYNVASPNSATGTILNDDTDVTVTVSPAAVLEDGPTNLVYTFKRNGVTSNAMTVNFSVGGTATFGTDYTQSGAATFGASSGTVTFGAGNSTATLTIDPTPDTTFEPDETVILTVTSGTGYNVASPSSATGTILNDDAQGGIISFSQSGYSVSESGGSVTITVNRTGDTSGLATVDYATPDDSAATSISPCSTINGMASPRCDFTTALGTLRFAAGETSKTFTVLISQDNYVEGPETLTLTLSNLTGGAVFGVPSTATLTIVDDATEPAANPIDDASNFVRQHYHDFLNREPDASGLAFWTNQITSCGSDAQCIDKKRVNVSAAFYLSIEFQNTGYLVERLYKTSYGDGTGTSTIGGAHQLPVPIVRFSEFLPDTQTIGQGVVVGQTGWETVLENNKQAFTANFVQRARFTNAYPNTLTPDQFVNMLFANAGVAPTSAERQAAIDEFGGAATSANAAARGRALRRVAENNTLIQQEFNRAFVLIQYFGYLRRNPDSAPDTDHSGYDFWLTKLNHFTNPGDDVLVRIQNAEMVKAFIVSLEYRHRFGQ